MLAGHHPWLCCCRCCCCEPPSPLPLLLLPLCAPSPPLAANGVLDAWAHRAQDAGRAALCVQWGNWGGGGMAGGAGAVEQVGQVGQALLPTLCVQWGNWGRWGRLGNWGGGGMAGGAGAAGACRGGGGSVDRWARGPLSSWGAHPPTHLRHTLVSCRMPRVREVCRNLSGSSGSPSQSGWEPSTHLPSAMPAMPSPPSAQQGLHRAHGEDGAGHW